MYKGKVGLWCHRADRTYMTNWLFHDKFTRWVLLVSVILIALVAMVTVTQSFNDPVENSDLVPAAVNNCVTGVKISLSLLDHAVLGGYTPEQITEFGTLPPRCQEPAVLAGIKEQIPYALAALEELSGVPTP